jgi:hypothetical protein
MTPTSRACLAAITLVAIVGWLDTSGCDAHGGRPIFGRGLFFRGNCPQPIPLECVPAKISPAPVEPAKKPEPISLSKDLRVNVKKIAELFKQGEPGEAHKLVRLTAPQIEEISDLMQMHRPASKGGFGSEANLAKLARKPDAPMARELAPFFLAMAELTLAKGPGKVGPGRKTVKVWKETAQQLREASGDLAIAGAQQDAKAIQKAVVRIQAACTSCHSIFKY